jgi:hypothetical protein
MTEIKTKASKASVTKYVAAIDDEERRADCKRLIKLMTGITGKPATMWGPSIVGFDSYHYKYASGHEGDMCLTGFSSRKPNLSIYIMAGSAAQKQLLGKLGKHKVAKACLYVRRLEDIDMDVLRELVVNSIAEVRQYFGKRGD